jgi:dihydrofolate reductase
MRTFDIVVAADRNRGIGKNGGLAWHLPGDMAYFKNVTSTSADQSKKNAVIMGRKTWCSIPEKFRPLKARLNVVLTRDNALELPDGVKRSAGLDEALTVCDLLEIETVFVIGGAAVYAAALQHAQCRRVYFTEVRETFDCDTFLPELDQRFVLVPQETDDVRRDGDVEYVFKIYESRDVSIRENSRQPTPAK